MLAGCATVKEQDVMVPPPRSLGTPCVVSVMQRPDSLVLRHRLQSDPDLMVLRSVVIKDGRPVLTMSPEEAAMLGIPLEIYRKYVDLK